MHCRLAASSPPTAACWTNGQVPNVQEDVRPTPSGQYLASPERRIFGQDAITMGLGESPVNLVEQLLHVGVCLGPRVELLL